MVLITLSLSFARYVPKLIVVPRCIGCGVAYTSTLTSDALSEDGRRIDPARCTACTGMFSYHGLGMHAGIMDPEQGVIVA